MRSILAKSLYLGLATLSLSAVAMTTVSVDASSKATIVSKSALGKGSKNVEVTGRNAIYTKPGTVKGAKQVASRSQVQKMAKSDHSSDYFRAYHMAVTSRGSVYYKVVSMNGKYRGYIYGGSEKGIMSGGVQEATTVKAATLPTRVKGFHLKNVKKNTLWTAPKNTTYKAHKVSLYGLTKKDTFTVSKAETKTREGSLYYYVTADKNADISGWIYAGKGYKDATTKDFGGLVVNEVEADATNDNSVKIVYRDANKSQVGSVTWITAGTNTHAGDRVNSVSSNVVVKPNTQQPGKDESKDKNKEKPQLQANKQIRATESSQSNGAQQGAGSGSSSNSVTAGTGSNSSSQPSGNDGTKPTQPVKPSVPVATVKQATNISGKTLAAFISGSVPSGYQLAKKDSAETLANAATYGNTVYVDVVAAASSKVQLMVNSVVNKIDGKDVSIVDGLVVGNKLSASDFVPSITAKGIELLSGPKGDTVNATSLLVELSTNAVKGSKVYHDKAGKSYIYTFVLDKTDFVKDNRMVTFGSAVKATYNATLSVATPGMSSSNMSWVAGN